MIRAMPRPAVWCRAAEHVRRAADELEPEPSNDNTGSSGGRGKKLAETPEKITIRPRVEHDERHRARSASQRNLLGVIWSFYATLKR
jgi:hypothetical protein